MYTSPEAAKKLGISLTTLRCYRWGTKRAIFGAIEQLDGIIKKGRQLYYTDAAIELLQANGVGSRCAVYCPAEEEIAEFEVDDKCLQTIFQEEKKNEDQG